MSRTFTEEEIREKFLKQVASIVNFWVKHTNKETIEDRCSGVAFSILSMLDGCSVDICGFKVIPCPHEHDKDFYIERGENYFPDDVDIAGSLHEEFYKYLKEKLK